MLSGHINNRSESVFSSVVLDTADFVVVGMASALFLTGLLEADLVITILHCTWPERLLCVMLLRRNKVNHQIDASTTRLLGLLERRVVNWFRISISTTKTETCVTNIEELNVGVISTLDGEPLIHKQNT